jgi:hypothetical protein
MPSTRTGLCGWSPFKLPLCTSLTKAIEQVTPKKNAPDDGQLRPKHVVKGMKKNCKNKIVAFTTVFVIYI